MASPIPSIVEKQIQTCLGLDFFKLNIQEDLGTQNPLHRKHIRESLCSDLQIPSHEQGHFFTQEVPVCFQDSFFSISHSKNLGGYALAHQPIGFDIELTQRIKKETVIRISKELEHLQAPHLSFLWCAKEAAFKALRSFQQPATMSQLEIVWSKESDSQIDIFLLKNGQQWGAAEGKGCVYFFDRYTLAVFSLERQKSS